MANIGFVHLCLSPLRISTSQQQNNFHCEVGAEDVLTAFGVTLS